MTQNAAGSPQPSNKVPFADFTRIHAPLKRDILARIESLMDRSAFVLGPDVEAFEKEFAAFTGSRHCIGVNSGLDALKLALQAAGVGPGHEVITQANTFVATAFAISGVGATPVLVDVEQDSYNLDPRQLERAITPRTKAIIPVHLYGQAATMGPILEIAASRKLVVIEDAAQAHGSHWQGKNVGTMGKLACFSFYPGKNLGTMGEGGGVTTDDEELRDRIRILRNVGQKEKYKHEVIGHNSRLHAMQALILSAKLPHLKAQNDDRIRIAKRYGELLGNTPGIQLPQALSDRGHVYHLYVIAVQGRKSGEQERDDLQKHLTHCGVQTLIHYPVPVHLQRCYASLGKGPGSFPVSESLASRILSLPMFPGMREDEIQQVARSIREFYG